MTAPDDTWTDFFGCIFALLFWAAMFGLAIGIGIWIVRLFL